MMGWSLNVFAVAIGGALGALCRYGISLLCAQAPLPKYIAGASHLLGGSASFATTAANLSGCLLLGLLYQWSECLAAVGEAPLSPRMMLALRVGMLGSLTTLSTLVGDAAVLATEGRSGVSLALMSANLIGGWVLFLAAAAAVRGVFS